MEKPFSYRLARHSPLSFSSQTTDRTQRPLDRVFLF
ncbi:uncharacterized protein METZ01_LOCUS488274, partial [marine metagenome]